MCPLDGKYDRRPVLAPEVDSLRRFLKIGLCALFVVRHKLLGIPRNERKPSALNLYHYSMALLESVRYAGITNASFVGSFGFKRLWLFKTVSESRRHRLAAK
jgi:hypothetical protein